MEAGPDGRGADPRGLAVRRPVRAGTWAASALAFLLIVVVAGPGTSATPLAPVPGGRSADGPVADTASNDSAVQNFSAAMNRLVALIGAAGGAVLAVAWARVAISWFSSDVTKKVQAKDRARDALIGTLIFVAALSGLIWALATWVLSGT